MGNHPSVDRGKQWIEQFLALSGLSTTVTAEIRESLCEHSCWLNIDTSNLTPLQRQSIIGDQGRVIDALQYLVNVTLNWSVDESEKGAYTVDLNGYREARHVVLEELATRAIAELAAGAAEAEIPGLSSAERRQLHHWLEQNGDYSTFSRGQEPDRRLVVGLKSAMPETD